MDITFESETVRHLGNLWATVNITQILVGLLIFFILCLFIKKLWLWYCSGARNKIERNSLEFDADIDKWENEINSRVAILDAIKSKEVGIRRELDALHRVKAEKDKTNSSMR